MIQVTRLDRQTILLNPDHIISIEETPDTVITLFNGHHLLVKERAALILNRIMAFRAGIVRRAGISSGGPAYLRRKLAKKYKAVKHEQSNSYQSSSSGLLHRQDF